MKPARARMCRGSWHVVVDRDLRRTNVDRAHAERPRVLFMARALVAVGQITEDEDESLGVLRVQRHAILEHDLVTAQRLRRHARKCWDGFDLGLTRLRAAVPALQ